MSEQIKLTINGKECIGEKGDTILKVAEKNGIEIPTLCHHESVKIYGACGMCVVEAENTAKLLRSCATLANDGMVINTESDRVKRSRKIALELLMSDHEGDCRGPCTINCPAETDCMEYVKAIANKDYTGAVKIIKEKIPFPASIGRVCPHPCEKACRRKMVEQPISIAALKAYAADRDLAGDTYKPELLPETGKKVAVIGGGPAGLSCAYYLRLKGHSVTVFDAMPDMGGMLRYGIPEYRLPKKVLDSEIKLIADTGVALKNNVKIGTGENTLEKLRAEYDAVVIAIGAWKSSSMRCPGENMEGVIGGIDMLRSVALYNAGLRSEPVRLGKKVAVIGGGNTAMDACRTAIRLGSEKVYVFYRRTRDEMPAEDIEIEEAVEEGVDFRFLMGPSEILGENGKVKAIAMQVMELGEPDAGGRRAPVPVDGKTETFEVDTIVSAIGQTINAVGFDEVEKNKKGCIAADEETFATSIPGVFAVGDATNKGAGIAIAAVAEGDKAAVAIDGYLRGEDVRYVAPYYSEREVTPDMIPKREREERITVPTRPATERRNDFREIVLPLSEDAAVKEAGRCLECGCHDYKWCKLIKYARQLPIKPARFAGEKNIHPTETRLVTIERNPGKCILCGLCVRECNEVAGKGILGLVGRGFTTVIKPEFNNPETISGCAACGKCVEVCPTGALRIIK